VPDQIQALERFDDLKPQTPGERRLAEYYDEDSGFNLEQMWNAGWNREGIRIVNHGGIIQDVVSSPVPSESEIVRNRICAATIIVFGRAVSRRALLNKSLSWLFTIYSIDVDEWVYPSSGGRSLQFSTKHGEVLVDGTIVRTELSGTPVPRVPLREDGVFFAGNLVQSGVGPFEGLVFHAFLPQPGAYLAPNERLAARAEFQRQVRQIKSTC
jgi:hypothetical protein